MSEPRNRPYDGQPHTDYGERGKTLVEGLTMRDIADCFNRACALSMGETNYRAYQAADRGKLVDLYELDWSSFDPGAIGQNLCCEIERMMGIFPNIPEALPNPTTPGIDQATMPTESNREEPSEFRQRLAQLKSNDR